MAIGINSRLSPYQQVTQWRQQQRERNETYLENQSVTYNSFFSASTTLADGIVSLATQQLSTRLQAEQQAKVAELQQRVTDVTV